VYRSKLNKLRTTAAGLTRRAIPRNSSAPPLNDQVARLQGEVTSLSDALNALAEQLSAAAASIAGNTNQLQDIERGLADVGSGFGSWLQDLQDGLSATVAVVGELSARAVFEVDQFDRLATASAPDAVLPARLGDTNVEQLRRSMAIRDVMTYLDHANIANEDVLITVVLPTRNRPESLAAAIESVRAQLHSNFELIVVDNDGTAATAACVDGLDDPRVRRVRAETVGAAGARNVGLANASGAMVTYLDDDNLMHPGWLRAVAWAFRRFPDTEVLYGARIVDHERAVNADSDSPIPTMHWLPYDRQQLETANYIDMNVICHRAGLPEANFDESLLAGNDWDLLLRLTVGRTPLELPAIACFYSTSAPDRISDQPDRMRHLVQIWSRIHTIRPMRVLSYNAMFPLLSETYIHEEMVALKDNGADIAFTSLLEPISPFPIVETIWPDLNAALDGFRPDVVMVYWQPYLQQVLPELESRGVPFALRSHSFDYDPQVTAQLLLHPLCVGVWAYPHHAETIPGCHALSPLFVRHAEMPEPAETRDLIMSVSAGLPKKNWPLLFEALDLLDDFSRTIVVGRSNGLEYVPDAVVKTAATLRRPPEVIINAPRERVFSLLSRTAVLLYTVDEAVPNGMPMSVIEAMRTGCCVVHIDDEAMRGTVGPGWRPYRTAADIERHVREIMAGGPLIEEERRRNKEWALAHFCDPEMGTTFHRELSDALVTWRTNHSPSVL
jgi:glycosyltransferase involved in cell wall biosynthesis